MVSTIGYLYIRFNEYLTTMYDACKLGITGNMPNRNNGYITGEVKPGFWKLVFEVPFEQMEIIEKLLQIDFQKFHIYHPSGATEIYKKAITDLVEPHLIKYGIEYKKLSEDEINNLSRTKREKKPLNKNKQELFYMLNSKRTNNQGVLYIPRYDQTIIIEKSFIYFQQYDKGILVLMCGVGKTLISLWVTQKLNSNNILIGVPNRLLLKQWEEVVRVLFQKEVLLIESGVDTEKIKSFLSSNQDNCIVITTYASSHKLYAVTKELDYKFDMKINDEVHHLTSNNINEEEKKTFVNMLKIDSKKQLSLTATLKILENKETQRDEDIIVSNDNIDYFGDIIDRKGLLWAIDKDVICDYAIQTIITKEEQLEQQLSRFHIIEENDKRLFLSAFASLKSISDGHSHHLLVYSNNKNNSLKLTQYIKMLLDEDYFDIPDLYYSDYHSEMKSKDQKEIINNFEKAKFGIITCVFCLGEGWDFPLLDGVVFTENMTSIIRIVQSALRASRKNIKDVNKISKIILTVLDKDDWLENNEHPDLKKVREVIYQIGLEDETITDKIKVFTIDIEKQKTKPREKEERETVDEFGEYDDELTKKLRLKTTKRTALSTTHEKAKKIIGADKSNVNSKESYYELCERNNRLPKEPEIVYKAQWKGWIDYLGIQKVYYDLETCKSKVSEYLLKDPEIKKHYLDLSIVSNELCKIDVLFPPTGLWVEYYNVKDLRDIITIPNKKKKIGFIL